MQIRTMQIEDYDAVFALWKSCSGMGLNDVDDSRSGIERFLQRNPETCLVAVEETAVIGAILVGSDGRRAYIYHTAVAPERQKQGIGSQMVQAAKKAVQKIRHCKDGIGGIFPQSKRQCILGKAGVFCTGRI